MSAADLRRAIDVREGLRAVLLQNNGQPLDEERVERLDRAVGRAAVRVRFAPGRDPALVTDARGVDGAIARLMAIVAAAVEHGRWERLKACPREECEWAFFDKSKNRSGAGARWSPAATSRRRRPSASAASAQLAYSSVWTLKRLVPPALPAGRPAVMPILSPVWAKPSRSATSAHASIRPERVHRLLVQARVHRPRAAGSAARPPCVARAPARGALGR